MKWLWRWIVRFFIVLTLLVLGVLVILGTELSLQIFRLSAPTFIPGLQVNSVEGTLWRGFRLNELHYQQADLQLELQQLDARISLDCVWQKQLCFQYLKLQQLSLKQQAAATASTAATTSNTAHNNEPATAAAVEPLLVPQLATAAPFVWAMPLPISIDKLQIQQLRLDSPMLALELAELSSQLKLDNQGISLKQPTIHAVQLNLPVKTAATSVTPAPATQITSILQQLKLPLIVELQQLKLTDLTVIQAQHQAPAQQIKLQQLLVSFQAKDDLWQLQQLQLQLSQPAIQLLGDLSLNNSALPELAAELQFSGDLLQKRQLRLKLAGPLQQIQSNWQLFYADQPELQLAATADLTQPYFHIEAKVKAAQLQWPLLPAVAEWQLTDVDLAVAGSLQQIALTVASQLQHATIPKTNLQLQANWQPGSILFKDLLLQTLNGEIRLQGELRDHNFKAASVIAHTGANNKQKSSKTATPARTKSTTQNTARAKANKTKQAAGPDWQFNAKATLDQLQPGLFWPDYPGELSGQLQLAFKQQPNLVLKLSQLMLQGELREMPFELTGDLDLSLPANGDLSAIALSVPMLQLKHGPSLLQLQGELAQQWNLTGLLKVPDLGQSIALSSGTIDGEFSLTGNAKLPRLELQLHATELNYLDDYVLKKADLEATLVNWGQAPSRLSVVAKNGQAPTVQLQQLDWRADGTLAQHESHLVLESHQLKLAAAIKAGWLNNQWLGQLTELRAKSDFGDWQLAEALTLSLQPEKNSLSLSASCWLNQAAKICLAAAQDLTARQGELKLSIEQLALAALNPLLPEQLNLAGTTDGEAQFSWLNGRPAQAQLQLNGQAGQLQQQSVNLIEVPWQQFNLTLQLQKQQLQSQLNIQLSEQVHLISKVALTDFPGPNAQVEASVQLAPYSLKFLQPLLNDFSQFKGLAQIDLTAKGALANPMIVGNINLSKLQLIGKQAPLELKDSALNIHFSGQQAQLTSELQTPNGPLLVSGQANWQVPAAWYGDLAVKGDLVKVHLMDAELSVSPDLKLTATATKADIRGTVKIPKGKILFNSLPENAIRVSEDEIIITAEQPLGSRQAWALKTDIKVQLGEQVQLTAFGLKTHLQGDLRVRQSGITTTMHGTVLLKNGTFRAYGQDLILRKGRLVFNGQPDQPLLAIEAIRNPEKTEDGVKAGLRVSGLADSPLIEVFSEPGKPQANALAYLLLGRDLGTSAADGSMTTSLIGIGIANSGKLVGSLGEAFGVSDLSVDTTGTGGDAKVTVSGYLSPKLQVKYGVGIFNQLGEFTLRYRLMQQLYLEAVSGLANSMDILYKIEFE